MLVPFLFGMFVSASTIHFSVFLSSLLVAVWTHITFKISSLDHRAAITTANQNVLHPGILAHAHGKDFDGDEVDSSLGTGDLGSTGTIRTLLDDGDGAVSKLLESGRRESGGSVFHKYHYVNRETLSIGLFRL